MKKQGVYHNRHTKTGTGGIAFTRERMQDPLPKPCKECPLRRDSRPGYLGGYSPEMYVDVLHGPASLACHSSPGFHTREIGKQRHCTGVAAYRANVGHVCEINGQETAAQNAVNLISQDTEAYFGTSEEFVAHHKPGQENGS